MLKYFSRVKQVQNLKKFSGAGIYRGEWGPPPGRGGGGRVGL